MIRRFPKTAAIAASVVAVGAVAAGAVLATNSATTPSSQSARLSSSNTTKAYGTPIAGRHTLLISVDGLHASDLAQYIKANPSSALALLSRRGSTYPNALTSFPSDSSPGIVALATGGTPKQTGVFYDANYDRAMWAPNSNCSGPVGYATQYNEVNNQNNNYLSGTNGGIGGFNTGAIDPANLPEAMVGGKCTPIYPNNYLLTNTIFEVAHNAGLYTAWSDKHPAVPQMLEGPDSLNPSGTPTINDTYSPEINSIISATNNLTVPFGPDAGKTALQTESAAGDDFTSNVDTAMAYDNTKVTAILNQIDGKTSTGGTPSGGLKVPSIFGMNFQAVSVGQKIVTGGYLNNGKTFSGPLRLALDYVNNSIGQFVAAINAAGLTGSTQIIITAKHGQSAKNRTLDHRIPESGSSGSLVGFVDAHDAQPVASDTADDVGLLWWQNPATGPGNVVVALNADPNTANILAIQHVYAGAQLDSLFGTPDASSNYLDPGTRAPDVVIQPQKGVIYSTSIKKVAEHGGGTNDDRNVALLVVDGAGVSHGRQINKDVQTTQVAPTILQWLGLKPSSLTAVQQTHIKVLPKH